MKKNKTTTEKQITDHLLYARIEAFFGGSVDFLLKMIL